jgi:hypothetical protein
VSNSPLSFPGSNGIPSEVWWLPRPPRSKYRGGFPRNFEQKLIEVLGRPRTILHPFGGMAELGTRLDLNPDVHPDVVGDAHAMPFEDESFELVVCDPPYSDAESTELYGTGPVRQREWMREAVRVASLYIVTYHVRLLPRPAGARLVRVIVVLLRPGHTARIVQVFRKHRDFPPQDALF